MGAGDTNLIRPLGTVKRNCLLPVVPQNMDLLRVVGVLDGGTHTKISLSEMLKMWPKMMTMMTMLTTSVLRPGPLASSTLDRRSSLAVVFPFSLVVFGRYFLYPVQAIVTEKIELKW